MLKVDFETLFLQMHTHDNIYTVCKCIYLDLFSIELTIRGGHCSEFTITSLALHSLSLMGLQTIIVGSSILTSFIGSLR